MPHAKSLRAIGQSLETLGLSSFVLEKRGLAFILHSDALPDLTELGKKESLDEKVWESSRTSRRIASRAWFAPTAVSNSIPATSLGSTPKDGANGASAFPRRPPEPNGCRN